MTDPIIHEPTLLDHLDCTVGYDNVSRLQAASLMSLINAYDRKLTRDNFISLAERAMAMHSQMAKLFLMTGVCEHHRINATREDGAEDFTLALVRTHHDILNTATEVHTDLRRLVKMVTECPTTQDKVH